MLYWFLPIAVFAQAGVGTPGVAIPDLFNSTKPGDLSVNILTQIFGHVPGVLYGFNFQLVSKIAGIFNASIVTVMGAVFAYTTLKLTFHACQEGEMMASKGKPLGMAVLRSVTGLALVVPAGSGYCIIQIFIVWLALQGIGFANTAWNGVVTYLTTQGGIYEHSNSDEEDSKYLAQIGDNFSAILQMEACVFKLQSLYQGEQKRLSASNAALASSGANDFGTPAPVSSVPASSLFGFGSGYTAGPNGIKTSYNFGVRNAKYEEGSTEPEKMNPYNAVCGYIPPVENKLTGDQMDSLLKIYMAPAAKRLAAYDPAHPDATLAAYVGQTISTVTILYNEIIAPSRKQFSTGAKLANENALKSSLNQGWIVAGAYYPLIARLGAATRTSLQQYLLMPMRYGYTANGDFSYPKVVPGDYSAFDPESISKPDREELYASLNMLDLKANDGKSKFMYDQRVVPVYSTYLLAFLTAGQTNSDYIKAGDKNNLGGTFAANGGAFGGNTYGASLSKGRDLITVAGWSGGAVSGVTMTVWAHSMVSIAEGFAEAIKPSKLDPLLELQKFGIKMQDLAVSYFLMTFAATFLTILAASFMPSVTVSTAMKASGEISSSLVTMWIAMCFTLGGALAYYLILILFLVWFTAVISWLGQVFQAVFWWPFGRIALG